MKLSYEDLISGDDILLDGVGHLRPTRLKELQPTRGIGIWNYNMYVNILAWQKEDFLKTIKATMDKKGDILDNDKLNVFDVMTLISMSRDLLQRALDFFIREEVLWDDKSRVFITKNGEDVIGKISRDNFDEVRDAMLKLNYIGLGKEAKPVGYSSKAAERAWLRAQQYLKQESLKKSEDKTMSLGNIISKLCAASPSYNLLNVYELTIFQLYDQFFQCGYLRAMNLNEMAFSNHGGKDFDIQAWIKPIIKF